MTETVIKLDDDTLEITKTKTFQVKKSVLLARKTDIETTISNKKDSVDAEYQAEIARIDERLAAFE